MKYQVKILFTFILLIGYTSSLILSHWVNSYLVKSECSKFMCKFCPDHESILMIDQNTGNMKDNSIILRVNASSILTSKTDHIEFELPHKGVNSISMSLFDYEYTLSLTDDGIYFNTEENDQCSFFAEKILANYIPYDAVINIDSILSVANRGWDVAFHNITDYNLKAKRDTFVIGLVGPYNTGKSFIASRLADKEFGVGFHIHTVGLSTKFADYDNRVATYLDTAGFETPMTFYKAEDKLFIDLYSKNLTSDEVKELKLKDRHITEHFLQNFIMEESDCILIVVGHLTFSDQKLINRILKQYGNSQKDIIIIHNYFQLTEVIQVHDAIETDIKGVFNVKKAPIEYNEDASKVFNREVYVNLDYKSVRHVITAREGTRAGYYFNPPVFYLMKSIVHSRTPREPFDIVKIMSEFVRDNLKIYANLPENKEPIVELDKNTQALVMRNIKDTEIKLKPIVFDMNGLMKSQTYDVVHTYDYYLNPTEKKLVFKVDLPGIKLRDDGKKEIKYRWDIGEKSCLILDAELEDNKEFNDKYMGLYKGRRSGKQRFTPPCIDHQYYVEELHTNSSFVDGVLSLTFFVDKNVDREIPVIL